MNINRFKALSFFLIAAYLLAACGAAPQSLPAAQNPKIEANTVAFTGVVEAMNDTQLTVGGQTLTLDPQVSLDPNIAVGDTVKVEANVSADGSVIALKVESSAQDDVIAPSSDDSSPSAPAATLDGSNPAASSNPATDSVQNEVFGVVEALTESTVTINGVTYKLTNSTEVKDILAVGDQVKLHVIVNADGTSTLREIEKSTATSTTVDDNSSNSNGSDDGTNHDANDDNSSSSGNGSDDGSNHDSNDDHGGDSGNSGSGG